MNLGQISLNEAESEVFCHFLEFGSQFLCEIQYDDSLQHCLRCSRCKAHKQKMQDPNLGQSSQNRAQNQVFCYFLKFGLLVFLYIAQDDSLKQCLTPSREKTHKKFSGPKIVPVFCHFLKFASLVFLDIAQDFSFRQFLTSSELKPRKKIGCPNQDLTGPNRG